MIFRNVLRQISKIFRYWRNIYPNYFDDLASVVTSDIPIELRGWWKSFQKAAYRHDYSRVFDDFITMTLTQFAPRGSGDGIFERWHADAMKPYNRDEKDAFNAMFFEILRVFKEQVDTLGKPYYDLFGQMYETISGHYKKSGLGQFFTPVAVADLISSLSTDEKPVGKRILDPCCGSGRLLFVAHANAPGNYVYGVDLDPLCAKMSVINCMLHGCVGEIVCGNGLWLHNDWRWAIAVNPLLTHDGIPSIMYIEKEQSWLWSQEMNGKLPPRKSTQEGQAVKNNSATPQLTLF